MSLTNTAALDRVTTPDDDSEANSTAFKFQAMTLKFV